MKGSKSEALELTYPVGTAARLTGLSPELIRAWERRYGVVEPLRTPGGTRRYSAEDIKRLRLSKAALDAGHRIGQIARLDLAELEQRAAGSQAPSTGRLDEILSALERLDGAEAQRLLSLQLSALGPARFAREFAVPLVREIGERWACDRLPIASEHLATGVLRSMLGSALQPSAASLLGPRIVFATPGARRRGGAGPEPRYSPPQSSDAGRQRDPRRPARRRPPLARRGRGERSRASRRSRLHRQPEGLRAAGCTARLRAYEREVSSR
jgi:DNA-binding transcriptional MerR regulator